MTRKRPVARDIESTHSAQVAFYPLAWALIAIAGVGLVGLMGVSDGLQNLLRVSLVTFAVGQVMLMPAGRGASPLSLIYVFSYCHLAIFILRPFYSIVFQSGVNIFTAGSYDGFAMAAAAVAGGGYVATCLGYVITVMLARHARSASASPQPEDLRDHLALDRALWFVVIMGFGLYAVYIGSVGPSSYFANFFSGRTAERSESIQGASAYLYAGILFAYGALLMQLLLALRSRKRGRIAWVSILLGVACLPTIVSGSRASFLPVVIAVLIIVWSLVPSVRRVKWIVTWVPAVIFFGVLAPRVWRDTLAQGVSFSDSLVIAADGDNFLAGFFGGLDTAMLDAFALQVLAQENSLIQPTLGATYLSAIAAPIPRILWPEKPVPVDTILNAVIFPATHSQGIGFSFGVYSEPFLNFGVIGVALILLIVGVALALIQVWSMRSRDPIALFVLALTAGSIFPIFRGSISFDLQRLLMPMIPVLIVWWICRHTPHNRDVRSFSTLKETSHAASS